MSEPTVDCEACGRRFGGTRAFDDAHRWGRCANLTELRSRRLTYRDGVWRQPSFPKEGRSITRSATESSVAASAGATGAGSGSGA